MSFHFDKIEVLTGRIYEYSVAFQTEVGFPKNVIVGFQSFKGKSEEGYLLRKYKFVGAPS
jgi:hypothetical protein